MRHGFGSGRELTADDPRARDVRRRSPWRWLSIFAIVGRLWEVTSALGDVEPLFFNNMTLVLDRYFVHRVRTVTGKDANPAQRGRADVGLLDEQRRSPARQQVIKLTSERSVLELDVGDRIRLGAARRKGSRPRLGVPAPAAVIADPSTSCLGRDSSLSNGKLDRVHERVLAGAAAKLRRDRRGSAQLGGRDAVIAVHEKQSLLRVEHDDGRGVLARSDVVFDAACVEMRGRIDMRAREHVVDS